jgi:predicted secreted protein
MVMRRFLLGVCAFGVSASVAAAPQPPTPTAKGDLDPNEVVCEKQEVIGSRLAVRRVCMTRSQWAERRMEDRQATEKIQTKRGVDDY